MTRITLGELKIATRDRSLRRAPAGTRASFPTPMPTATSAVRRFHRDGAAAATAQLNGAFSRSSYWGPAGPAQAQGWANSIRSCFATYANLASQDHRPALSTPVTADVDAGQNSVGVSVDVVLLDPSGYVARYLLWDTPALVPEDAEILAAPVVQALENELGAGRVAGVEVWHLRSGHRLFVSASTALARLPDVAAVVRSYVG